MKTFSPSFLALGTLLIGAPHCHAQSAPAAAAVTAAANPQASKALLEAARKNDLAAIQSALALGADVNARDKAGRSALHVATQIGAPKPRKKGPIGLWASRAPGAQ